MFDEMQWIQVRDGDRRALNLYLRHYSSKYRSGKSLKYKNAERFTPPGESIILLTPNCDALFVWVKMQFRDDKQKGINCSIFRNEGKIISSRLISEAEKIVWSKWPGERLFTYIDPNEVNSVNPGYCFKMAGWRFCGKSLKNLHILEKEQKNDYTK